MELTPQTMEELRWVINQGVAVAVLLFVLFRLERAMASLQASINTLLALHQRVYDDSTGETIDRRKVNV